MRRINPPTFGLTSINSRVSTARTARGSYSFRCEKSKATSALPDQVIRLKSSIRDFRHKNRAVSDFLSHFERSNDDLNERDNLIKNFQRTFIEHTKTLQKRLDDLELLEKQALIFRPESEADEQRPIKLPDSRVRPPKTGRRRIEWIPPPRYEKPKRRIFPPRSPDVSFDVVKLSLSKVHERLTEKALYLERLILLQKLRLKICHDHRELSQLKDELEFIEMGREEEDEEEISDLKNSISILKERIIHEKKRIGQLQYKHYHLFNSAVKIQKCWRGYCVRNLIKKEERGESKDDNKENDQNDDDSKKNNVNNAENEKINEMENNADQENANESDENNEISTNESQKNNENTTNESGEINENTYNEENPTNESDQNNETNPEEQPVNEESNQDAPVE